jgi:hypothetical protein
MSTVPRRQGKQLEFLSVAIESAAFYLHMFKILTGSSLSAFVEIRGGLGLIFLGSGQARATYLGLGLEKFTK